MILFKIIVSVLEVFKLKFEKSGVDKIFSIVVAQLDASHFCFLAVLLEECLYL